MSLEETNEINDYVKANIPKQIDNYKMIISDGIKIRCVLILKKDDCIIIDEIHIVSEHRNRG